MGKYIQGDPKRPNIALWANLLSAALYPNSVVLVWLRTDVIGGSYQHTPPVA